MSLCASEVFGLARKRRRAFDIRHVCFAALGLWLSASMAFAAEASRIQKEAASLFASKGMITTLGACVLPKTCALMQPVKAQRDRRTTSNDFVVDQRTLTFDGLLVEFWYVLDAPALVGEPKHPYDHPQILRLLVSKDRWPVAQGLRVGTSKAMVVRKFGPGVERGDCTEYVNDDKEDMVRFCFRKNRVHSIEWMLWNDA